MQKSTTAAILLIACLAASKQCCLADSSRQSAPASQLPLKGGVDHAASVQSSTSLFTDTQDANHIQPQQFSGAPNRGAKPVAVPPVVKKNPPKEPPKSAGDEEKPPTKLWGQVDDKNEEEPKKGPKLWGEPPEQPDGEKGRKPHIAKLGGGEPSSPSNGVTSWQPGYGVTEVKVLPTPKPALSAVAGRLRPQPRAREAVAAQLALPRHLPANWNEWYDRVARAIYQVWQQQSVKPGSATVRATVYDSTDVDCAVTDFEAAADLQRNPVTESHFRDAALCAVSSIDKSTVCQFPLVHPRKVSFDIQLTRLADGPAGCHVIRVRDSEQTTKSASTVR
ncbi:MAG TPA: hypothetical protein V6C81_12280 [Planktothrix sp.]|jgi:hypothetical protein